MCLRSHSVFIRPSFLPSWFQLLLLAVTVVFYVGCKTTQFENINRDEDLGTISCAVQPPTGDKEESFEISVSGLPSYTGRIQQVIKGPKAGGVSFECESCSKKWQDPS